MKEKELVRFGVSMPQDLAEQFDGFITEQGYGNRSEAIRDLVRKVLLQPERLSAAETVAGTVVIVYDHHVSDLSKQLTELQHEYHHDIISTMHVHLNHEQCLEIVVVQGAYGRLRLLTDSIQVLRGVSYAELSVSHIEVAGTAHRHSSRQEGHDHGHAHGHRHGKAENVENAE
jgi:CopG family nickel-responsive transcriptional regulator